MATFSVTGQPVAQKIIESSLAGGRVSHAYLFSGPDGTGKSILALEFARHLTGSAQSTNHPDILVCEPEGATFKIDQARWVQRELSMKPLSAGRRVAIIKQAERMTAEAANSLLKVLEDPPAGSVLMLLTSNVNAILPTIVSRCQVIPFRPALPEDVEGFLVSNGVPLERARTAAALSQGIIGKALSLASDEGPGKERALAARCLSASDDADPFEKAARFSNDRSETAEILSFIAWLIRDAIAVASGANEAAVLNLDAMDVIEPLSLAPGENLMQAMHEANKARDRIEHNCSIQCTLELMFMRFEKLIVPASGRRGR
ncbi:MAG: DNA polymerase III subunit [Bacillota bacterium]|nr:DNA polymerase III subunit [Bacillota bacterium]